MNPSTALATVVVDELVRGGVREAVLSPGSRSAPLALALHAADRDDRLRLHVRIDERAAAFLALGLAKGSGDPVPVVTTSGTAVANCHPAVLEACHAGVGLLVLSADRPPELRGAGANQTIDQLGIFGTAVRAFHEVGVPEQRVGQNAYWRALTCRMLAQASGDAGGAPGPVHANIALREPLVPGEGDWPEHLDGRADGGPWTTRVLPLPASLDDDLPARTVVVIGDGTRAQATAALHLAQMRGWPVIAEPFSGAGPSPQVIPAADLLLSAPGFLTAHRPERVLVVGRPTLSRAVGALTRSSRLDVVAARGQWADPARFAHRVLPAVPAPVGSTPEGVLAAVVQALEPTAGQRLPVDSGWLPAWQQAAKTVQKAAARAVAEAQEEIPEPAVAARTLAAVPAGGLLVVGSSKPVRDLFLQFPQAGVTVLANRGVAGIDGMVSTAMGAALAHGGPAYALVGDLTFLHDSTGLVLGPHEPRPDLTVVVVNNHGGAIFGSLEQAGVPGFERVFGTPHGVDITALCAATGMPHARPDTLADLDAALAPAPGLRVVEVLTDRTAAVALEAAIRSAVAEAVSSLPYA